MGEANIALVVNRNLADFLGIAMVGGLILSQLLTHYTTVVVYIYLDASTCGSAAGAAAAHARHAGCDAGAGE